MNSNHSRSITSICDICSQKLQAVSEVFILSCEARPARPSFVDKLQNSQSGLLGSSLTLGEKLTKSMKTILTLMNSLITHVHMISTKWFEVCEGIQELTGITIDFIELASHMAYLMVLNMTDVAPVEKGLVNKFEVGLSGLEIKMSCHRLKKARVEELSPQLIIDLCSNISKHITIITDICRNAGEQLAVREERTSDQFKLSVKSVTCAAGCLIASIMSYKAIPSSTHRGRIVTFCEPVMAASAALVSFATEEEFTGKTAVLTSEGQDAHKAVLGATMSIVSSCIQLCRIVRDLAYDMMTSHYREKLHRCTESVHKSSAKLKELVLKFPIPSDDSLLPHSHMVPTQGFSSGSTSSFSQDNETSSLVTESSVTALSGSDISENSVASR